MDAAWYRARSELRGGWRAAIALALLVAVVGGVVLTTVAGARRSATAYDRFRRETLASDLDVAFDGPPSASIDEAAGAARMLPQVAALSRLDFPFLVPAGSGFYPYLDFLAAVRSDGGEDMRVDRPRVLEGRLPDPDAAEEVAISATYARESGLRVGDSAEFESYAPAQLVALFESGDAGPPAGPRFTLVVSAIFDAPTFLSESSGDFQPRMLLSPGFVNRHGQQVATYIGGFALRLHGGAADAEEVTEKLRSLFPGDPLEITPASEVDRKIESGIGVIVTALTLCSLVTAVAGGVAIAQALSRHFAAQTASYRCLNALGMTRAERVISQTIPTVPSAIVGALVAVVVSVLASPLLPVGIARRAEPSPGLAVDVPVVLLGFVGIVMSVLAVSVLTAAAATRRARTTVDESHTSTLPSRSMAALRRASLTPPRAIGLGLALAPRGGTRVAVRSALLGVVTATMGLVAVLVFLASVDALVRSPQRYGSPADAYVSGFTGDALTDGDADLLADPRAVQVGLGYGGLARIGGEEVNTYALESLKGDMAFTMLEGHEPTGGAEVALGTSTMASAGLALGDEVEIDGGGGSLRATVVGRAVFPVTDERSAPGRGILLGREELSAISSVNERPYYDLLIKWADGVDPEAANAALATATGTEVFAPRLPSDVNNLREVTMLPRALAVFICALAAAGVAHALVTTLRIRRRELAALRAIGFVRRQVQTTVIWQAIAIGLLGVALGLPLGTVVGRLIWNTAARSIGVVEDPVIPTVGMLAVPLAALFLTGAAAVIPSHLARRIPAHTALRVRP